jgi:hypothetical protein
LKIPAPPNDLLGENALNLRCGERLGCGLFIEQVAPARCASRIPGIKIGSQSYRPHRGYRGKPSSRNATQWQDVAALAPWL